MFDHFDFIAPIYDRVIQPRKPERLLSLLDSCDDHIILDAGGGTGRISQYFAEKDFRVVIADLSAQMLQKALEKEGLEAVRAPIERLPFENDAFCCIIMVDAFHHVLNQEQVAAELWRVLKPGGRLIIEEPDVQLFSIKLVALAEKLALMRSRFISPGKIAGFFDDPLAKVTIQTEVPNAWVIVDKGNTPAPLKL